MNLKIFAVLVATLALLVYSTPSVFAATRKCALYVFTATLPHDTPTKSLHSVNCNSGSGYPSAKIRGVDSNGRSYWDPTKLESGFCNWNAEINTFGPYMKEAHTTTACGTVSEIQS